MPAVEMHTTLLGLAIAITVASGLALFAYTVLSRTPTHSAESSARGTSSGLSLDEKRKYEQQVLRNRKQPQSSSSTSQKQTESSAESTKKSVMQPPRTDLAPPKDDPFTMEHLKQFDGSDPSKPIYVAIKGAPRFPPLLACPLLTLPPSGRTRHCF